MITVTWQNNSCCHSRNKLKIGLICLGVMNNNRSIPEPLKKYFYEIKYSGSSVRMVSSIKYYLVNGSCYSERMKELFQPHLIYYQTLDAVITQEDPQT